MTTTDDLDFKHHNYKEMRQVSPEYGVPNMALSKGAAGPELISTMCD